MGDEIVGRCASDTFGFDAAIAIAVQHASFVIDGNLVEIEKVSLRLTTALLPNTALILHRVVRCGIDCVPRLPAIISGRNK